MEMSEAGRVRPEVEVVKTGRMKVGEKEGKKERG